MSFKSGVQEAAKMLAGLRPLEREKVLLLIARQDAQMAELLKKHMVILEDLKFLTVKMLQELLREIEIKDLAFSLRRGSEELKLFFLNNLSSGMKREIEDVLDGPPLQVSLVEEAEERVMSVVRKMVDEGRLVLKEGGNEEYV